MSDLALCEHTPPRLMHDHEALTSEHILRVAVVALTVSLAVGAAGGAAVGVLAVRGVRALIPTAT